MVIDVPYGVDILRLRLWGMSDIHLSNIGCNIQGPVGQRIGEGPWNATGLVIKEHEPDQVNAAAKIRNVDRFDHAAHYTSAGCSGSREGLCDGHAIGIDAVWLHC